MKWLTVSLGIINFIMCCLLCLVNGNQWVIALNAFATAFILRGMMEEWR